MKQRNVLAVALVALLGTTLVLTGCGKSEEKNPENSETNQPVVEKNLDDQANQDEMNDEEKELLTEETYKMHMKSYEGETVVMEAIIQKDENKMAMEYIVLPKDMEAMGMKMKKMLFVDDNGYFMQMEINGENKWIKLGDGTDMREDMDATNGINPKKLLKKLKAEGVEKTEKEVRGDTYDCYLEEDSEMCFDGDELKYILDTKENYTMEIVEYTDDVDSNAFKIPSETIDQKEMMQMMMANAPTE